MRDFRDIFRMFRWFLGLGPKPTFDRWTYWEKFDYWAVFWGVGIIGTSGLVLWFPETFSLVLPGTIINIAKVIHSEEALLATGFIFTIHVLQHAPACREVPDGYEHAVRASDGRGIAR
jgi:cytochrome b subunit of formate dehydrogenase